MYYNFSFTIVHPIYGNFVYWNVGNTGLSELLPIQSTYLDLSSYYAIKK